MRQLLQLCISAVLAVSASAAAQTATATAKPVAPNTKPFYRGSSIAYRNAVAAVGLSAGAEPTHNPYYGMQLAFQPRVWFGDLIYARASFDIATELTRADWTNDRFFISDLGLAVGTDTIYTIPKVDVDVSAELSFSIPTSLASRASSRLLVTSGSVALSRAFGAFSLSYGGGFDKFWNAYTTGAPTGSLVGVCAIGNGTGCVDVVIQTGRRNVDWSMSHGLSAGYKLRPWLSFGLGMTLSAAYLYGLPDAPQISLPLDNPGNVRFFLASSASVTLKPTDFITLSLGARSVHGQLAPDGSYRIPLINRFTQLYLDLGLNVASVIARLKS